MIPYLDGAVILLMTAVIVFPICVSLIEFRLAPVHLSIQIFKFDRLRRKIKLLWLARKRHNLLPYCCAYFHWTTINCKARSFHKNENSPDLFIEHFIFQIGRLNWKTIKIFDRKQAINSAYSNPVLNCFGTISSSALGPVCRGDNKTHLMVKYPEINSEGLAVNQEVIF